MCDSSGSFNPLYPFLKIKKGPEHHEFDLRKLKKCADGFVVWNDCITNLISNSYPHHNIQKKIIVKVKKNKYWHSIPTKKHPYAGDGEICTHKVIILEHAFHRKPIIEDDNESGVFVNENDFIKPQLENNMIVTGSASSGTISISPTESLESDNTTNPKSSSVTTINNDIPFVCSNQNSNENVTILPKTNEGNFIEKTPNTHLVVFVHGLEGTPHDLSEYPYYLAEANPGTTFKFYNSQSNVEKTWTDINELGKNLFTEINLYVQLMENKPTKISFMAHSMGGIIVRSMFDVEGIENLKPYFHTFLTFNSPHCGINYGSKRVSIGARFLEWWFNSNSMKQLSLKDSNALSESFLYKLSQNDSFSSFKNVLLVGNYEDNFVCGSSALIEHNSKSYYDKSHMGRLYNGIIENIENSIVNSPVETTLIKYIVTHDNDSGYTFDRIIGRDGHIHPCDDLHFIEKLIYCSAGKYFS
uniref:DUF676 domain-containing protein n=1 Tax=Parastrongyloides trichosuri TaxID=131310 RepID=A0A0N4ZPK6_PARTI